MPFNIEDQYQQYLYPESLGSGSNNDTNYGPMDYVDGKTSNARSVFPEDRDDSIKVLILNNPSKINKTLLKFFTKNIDIMNQNGMIFDWIVVYEDEMEQYEEQEITEFPVLVFKNEHIIGADAIINYLLEGIPEENLKSSQVSKKNKNYLNSDHRRKSITSINASGVGADSDIRNYFLRELDNHQEDADEDDIFANTVTQRVAAMNKARQINGQPTLKMSNPEIHERTARAASRQHNYRFNEGPQNYDKSLQNAMNTARKQTERHHVAHQTRARNDNLDEHGDDAHDNNFTPNTPNAVDIAKSTSDGSMDDELMLRYWENNTELGDY